MIQIPIDLETATGATLQERIFSGIRGAVLSRKLSPGSRLPSSRDLAKSLGLSRNTVVPAYDRLSAEGYIEFIGGVGTFVSNDLPEGCLRPVLGGSQQGLRRGERVQRRPMIAFTGQRPIIVEKGASLPSIGFWFGRASRRIFPVDAWRRLIAQNLGRAAVNLVEYPPAAGLPELRHAIAEHLATNRGIRTNWRNIIITAGAQEAFDIIGKLFVKEGTRVAIERMIQSSVAPVT